MNRRPILVFAGLLSSLWADPGPALADQKDDAGVPKEVQALVGTYTGAWAMFGIDEKGAVVQKMAWTDTMKAAAPKVDGGRAYVTTTDEMKFEGAKGPPFKVEGREGFYLAKDGTIADPFIETFGQIQRLTKLGPNSWSYAATAAEPELTRMGFPKGAAGQHVLVKVVTTEQGVETHRISRVTTVTWKDSDSKERALQFVSLQGHHKRQP